MHAVKKCVVTDLDFDSRRRRAEVIVVGIRASDSSGGRHRGTAEDSGYLIAQVRRALAGYGVREAWATVEVEYATAAAGLAGGVVLSVG